MGQELNAVSGTLATTLETTGATEVIAAKAGYAVNIDTVIVTNSDATVGTVVKILNGTTAKVRNFVAAAGGGFALTLPTPIRGAINTAWNVQCETTSAEVTVTLAGFYSRV